MTHDPEAAYADLIRRERASIGITLLTGGTREQRDAAARELAMSMGRTLGTADQRGDEVLCYVPELLEADALTTQARIKDAARLESVPFVLATAFDPLELVRFGRLREDLYYFVTSTTTLGPFAAFSG